MNPFLVSALILAGGILLTLLVALAASEIRVVRRKRRASLNLERRGQRQGPIEYGGTRLP